MGKDMAWRARLPLLLYILSPAGLLLWLLSWILHFGPVLINDEYAAIDYFYRIVRRGGLYPTPDRLHKPLSVLMGFFSWVFESPLAFEVAVAIFAALLCGCFYLAVRRELGTWPAVVSALLVAFHPDLIYYSATGSTVIIFSALSFAAVIAVLKRGESGRWLWVYAGCFFLAGLARPESWLFAGPLLLWWRPARNDRSGWIRLLAALAIIALAPLIWFGKDWIINNDIMHGLRVTKMAKTVGAGAPFSVLKTTSFFLHMIIEKVSWPVAAAAVFGAVMFVRERGFRDGLLHPFIVFPALVSGYVWFVVYMGVFPNTRYYYLDTLFVIVFCLYLAKSLVTRIALPKETMAKAALLFLALFPAIALALTRPQSATPDGRWLMLVIALLAVFFATLVLWYEQLRDHLAPVLLVGVLVLLSLSYPAFLHGLYKRELAELALEADKQKEMVQVANLLSRQIPPGGSDRIMMPSRRDEQLSWWWRNRELPEVVTLREAFYLDEFKGIDFLELHPHWIMYVPNDYQFWGPDRMFAWLWHQDRAVLRGIEIELVMDLETIRVFKVTYPSGHPPKAPIPPIP